MMWKFSLWRRKCGIFPLKCFDAGKLSGAHIWFSSTKNVHAHDETSFSLEGKISLFHTHTHSFFFQRERERNICSTATSRTSWYFWRREVRVRSDYDKSVRIETLKWTLQTTFYPVRRPSDLWIFIYTYMWLWCALGNSAILNKVKNLVDAKIY